MNQRKIIKLLLFVILLNETCIRSLGYFLGGTIGFLDGGAIGFLAGVGAALLLNEGALFCEGGGH